MKHNAAKLIVIDFIAHIKIIAHIMKKDVMTTLAVLHGESTNIPSSLVNGRGGKLRQ